MTRFFPALVALVALTSCTAPTIEPEMKGPQAVGVSPDAPKDPVGIMLSWTPDQTITNFEHLDRLFPVRTVSRGSPMLDLPNGEPIDPIVPLEDRRLTVDQLMDEYRVTGVIALHHGRIVLERYAHDRTAQDRWFSASAAKSITSTLIGAAVRDGLIGSVDDPITRYIPELKSVPAFEGVTLRHLMTMSSGLRFHESTADPTSDLALTDGGEIIDGRPPIVSYAMKLTRAHPPGTVKEYQTIDADLVGIALSRVLKGRTVSDYLSEKIWRPAGMEADANWVLDKTGIERESSVGPLPPGCSQLGTLHRLTGRTLRYRQARSSIASTAPRQLPLEHSILNQEYTLSRRYPAAGIERSTPFQQSQSGGRSV